jgi:heme exporter protein B
MSYFILIQSEIIMTLRQASSWMTPLLFFVIVVCFFPLALGPDSELLQTIAPSIIWVAAMLAMIISTGNIFRNDMEDGFLDILLLSQCSLTLLTLCKIFSHWLTHALPLIIISPLLAFLLHLPLKEQYVLMITLLLGTPVLSLIGGIGAGLVIGIRNRGLLLPILIMPFYIPVLIFGTGTIQIAATHQPVIAYYAIMAAILLITLAFAPLFTGMALKIGVNQ